MVFECDSMTLAKVDQGVDCRRCKLVGDRKKAGIGVLAQNDVEDVTAEAK